jgi:hypothetical protein
MKKISLALVAERSRKEADMLKMVGGTGQRKDVFFERWRYRGNEFDLD